MQQPFVSILITAYNREQYIAAAIESVLALHYDHYELIITDDCSTDRTLSIAQEYATRDERIRVYANEKNLGDYGNRNRAASYAKGKYLKYLDADDLIYPYSLRIMVEAMEKFPAAGLGMEEPFYDKLYEPFPITRDSSWIYKTHFLKKGVIYVGPSAAIIPTDVFRSLGGFSGTRYIGDTELWLKIAAKYPVVFFQPALVFWRQHEGQEIVSEKRNNTATMLRHELNKRLIKNAEHLLSRNDQQLALNKCNRRLIFNIVAMAIKNGDLRSAFFLFKNARLSIGEMLKALFH